MKKLLFILPMLMLSVMMTAAPQPLRVVVLGDDPMMVSDEATGAVGYATLLQPFFDDAVTVDVQASSVLLPADPDVLLEPANKGDVALICNDEGKLMQMKPSRAIFDEDGHVMDVIAGPFFICYAPIESETFLSLPDDLKEEMRKKFELPERYYRSDEGLMVLKYDPKDLDREPAR